MPSIGKKPGDPEYWAGPGDHLPTAEECFQIPRAPNCSPVWAAMISMLGKRTLPAGYNKAQDYITTTHGAKLAIAHVIVGDARSFTDNATHGSLLINGVQAAALGANGGRQADVFLRLVGREADPRLWSRDLQATVKRLRPVAIYSGNTDRGCSNAVAQRRLAAANTITSSRSHEAVGMARCNTYGSKRPSRWCCVMRGSLAFSTTDHSLTARSVAARADARIPYALTAAHLFAAKAGWPHMGCDLCRAEAVL